MMVSGTSIRREYGKDSRSKEGRQAGTQFQYEVLELKTSDSSTFLSGSKAQEVNAYTRIEQGVLASLMWLIMLAHCQKHLDLGS